jgi:hypothetical protein
MVEDRARLSLIAVACLVELWWPIIVVGYSELCAGVGNRGCELGCEARV